MPLPLFRTTTFRSSVGNFIAGLVSCVRVPAEEKKNHYYIGLKIGNFLSKKNKNVNDSRFSSFSNPTSSATTEKVVFYLKSTIKRVLIVNYEDRSTDKEHIRIIKITNLHV